MERDESSDTGEAIPVEPFAASYPSLEERIAQHEQWVQTVRDPANLATEGIRRLEARNGRAVAEYEIAPLPDGGWAIRTTCSYRTGDCSGVGVPWSDFGTREECVAFFLEVARRHFDHASGPTALRSEMRGLLRETLYGFVEPNPQGNSLTS